ncbi:host cell factor C1 regulator 1-like [Cebus imitator]|uniref:host cell factor C1 regulator 1-like n=1 Tax=Cebus imitator TaxID=2715852 RepID=UPI001898EA5E|nr:host cell factor C1 regulator 1-like [Cebus imitator]
MQDLVTRKKFESKRREGSLSLTQLYAFGFITLTRGLDAREPLSKQFLSEENTATHFSQLSLHNDHPYCSPPMAFPPALPPLRNSCSELLLWRYPGSLIPEALWLLRQGDTPSPSYPATPAGDIMEL